MRIALAQINTTVGAIEANARKVLEFSSRAAAQGADLVAFPELTLTGYPPKDLLDRPDFIEANLRALDDLAGKLGLSGQPGVVLGFVDRSSLEDGKGLHNAAALIDGGRIISRHYKSLLPTYDVFDEHRHFDPAPEVHLAHFRGKKLSITICEDFWNDRLYWKRRKYAFDPVEELAKMGAELMVTISASPYELGKPKIRSEMYCLASRRHKIPLAHVNLIGGNDNLIFNGRSNFWTPAGERHSEAPAYEESLLIADPWSDTARTAEPPQGEDAEVYGALVLGVRDYVTKCGFSRVLIGLSGGIDSALTAAIAVDALGRDRVTGVAMPSEFSSTHSVEDARTLASNLGIEFHVLPIKPVYSAYLQTLEPVFAGTPFGIAEENVQARIRGNLLMALSNKFGWLVLTTGNKSELAVGYCTLYGDMSGGLAVISDVFKTRVYRLSKWVNRAGERIPRNTIEKEPSAELRPNQLDTDSLPPYEALDPILEAYIEQHKSLGEIAAAGADPEIARRILRMVDRNEYKRQQAPMGLKVTGKAFGAGRRMPIARGEFG